jgi:hypothetical protein
MFLTIMEVNVQPINLQAAQNYAIVLYQDKELW